MDKVPSPRDRPLHRTWSFRLAEWSGSENALSSKIIEEEIMKKTRKENQVE
jgi:hypothetical protein